VSLSPEQYGSGRKGLRGVLQGWDLTDASSPSAQENAKNQFAAWLKGIQEQGWTRKDVHRLVWELLDERPPSFSESTLDELGEFETALTGFCAPKYIVRFPNDPADETELVDYVRGDLWR